FDAKQAREHQEAWAKYLGVNIETPIGVGGTMVLIPPSDEVAKPYFLGKYEVTQGEWEKVMGYNPSDFGPKNPKTKGLDTTKFPVENVSWYDSVEFCNKLSEQERLKPYYDLKVTKREANDGKQIEEAEVIILGGNGYHIPMDAEWAHGCLAGSKSKYHFGDKETNLPEYAWFKDNSDGRSHGVGEKKPNGFGLFDMHGNVVEWIGEMLSNATSGAPERVHRGGHWNDPAGFCAVSPRSRFGPAYRSSSRGLRIARAADVEGTPPPLAKAPFDAKQAREHQEAWAKYLGVKVETPVSVGGTMVLIPPGDEVAKPYFLGKYEVTQAEWEKVMGYNPSGFGPKNPKVKGLDTSKFPVESVSWFDSVEFCNKLSVSEGLKPYYELTVKRWIGPSIEDADVKILGGNGYHLPTDVEWTHGCAAGSKGKFHFGDKDEDLPDYAWIQHISDGRTHVVGEKRPNAFGLYDMHGNVWEWNEEMLTNISSAAPERVTRGGAWSAPAGPCLVSNRARNVLNLHNMHAGFRVARNASPQVGR
ncbi:MAG: formylglycine-generating enzyme family protein, partial [Planctomycetes bacterium]|nr:formylglycine-generating enzyme family protein [Planctomycetota bacterium]